MVCLAGFFGYVTGVGLLLAGILKPFFPSHVGIYHSGFGDPRHERLDQMVVLIALALVSGAIILILTTYAIRSFLSLSQRVQRSL